MSIAARLRTGPSLLLDLFHFIRRFLPVLPRLIDERGGKELRRIELGDREPVEPRLAPTTWRAEIRAGR
jgi:hypothetical protein